MMNIQRENSAYHTALRKVNFSIAFIVVTVSKGPSLVPRPSYHGVPDRGPGNNSLCMRLIKTARYA